MEPEVLKERIITRNNERDTWKLDNWETFIAGINEKKCCWQHVNYIKFNNGQSQIDEETLLSHFE